MLDIAHALGIDRSLIESVLFSCFSKKIKVTQIKFRQVPFFHCFGSRFRKVVAIFRGTLTTVLDGCCSKGGICSPFSIKLR